MMKMMAKNQDIERFKKFVVIEGECWVWNGYRDSKGYGCFKVGGKKVKAHRWIYEALNGVLPNNLFVDHLCRNRACCRPAHLELTTPKENTFRGVSHR